MDLCNSIFRDLVDEHAPLSTKKMPRRQLLPRYNMEIQAAKRRRRYCEQLWIRTGVLVFVMKCSRSKLHESLHKSICVEILSPMNASHQYAELLATVLRISTI